MGAIYGGCINAILVGTLVLWLPPRPCLKACPHGPRRIRRVSTYHTSFVGGIVSALALIFIAPMLARRPCPSALPNTSRWPCSAYRGGLAVVRASHQCHFALAGVSPLSASIPQRGHAQHLR
ncbi:MAG: hypothetical protein ACLTTU_03490 [Bilophila wadsworthia]